MLAHPKCSTIGPEASASVPPAEPITATLNPSAGPQAICPKCTEAFQPKRRDQRYCSRTCQKATTNNAARGPRTIASSWEARRRHEARTGRVRGLSHAFYETPPVYRAEFMQRLIAEARRNAELRRLVTDRDVLRSWDRLRSDAFDGSQGTGRLPIAHVLDHFCRSVYALRSFEVLNPEAETPAEDALAFPAAYFGPDAPPVYEDGALRRRP